MTMKRQSGHCTPPDLTMNQLTDKIFHVCWVDNQILQMSMRPKSFGTRFRATASHRSENSRSQRGTSIHCCLARKQPTWNRPNSHTNQNALSSDLGFHSVVIFPPPAVKCSSFSYAILPGTSQHSATIRNRGKLCHTPAQCTRARSSSEGFAGLRPHFVQCITSLTLDLQLCTPRSTRL